MPPSINTSNPQPTQAKHRQFYSIFSMSSPLFLFFLLLLSFFVHVCDGRLLKDSSKGDTLVKIEESLVMQLQQLTKGALHFREESHAKKEAFDEISGGETREGRRGIGTTRIVADETTKMASSSGQIQSHVTASWRVPRTGKHSDHPGFNADYAGPRTHPPSHN